MLQVSRTVLARLGRPLALGDRARSIAVAVTAPIDPHVVLGPLAVEIARHGTMRLLSAAGVDAALGRSGLVESGHAHTVPALAEFLQEAETTHDYLLLEMDTTATRWTKVASALADRVVVVMSARPGEDEVRRAADGAGRRAGRGADRAVAGTRARPRHRTAVGIGGGRRPPRLRPGGPRPRGVRRRRRPPGARRVGQRDGPRARRRRRPRVRPPRRLAGAARARHRGGRHRRGVDRGPDGRDDGPAARPRCARAGGRRAVPRAARLHRARRLPAEGRADRTQHHARGRRRRRARHVAPVLLRVDEPHPLERRGPRSGRRVDGGPGQRGDPRRPAPGAVRRRPPRRRRRAEQPAVRRDAQHRHGGPADRRRPVAAGRTSRPGRLRPVGVGLAGVAHAVARSSRGSSP